jgi:hypothetical protein
MSRDEVLKRLHDDPMKGTVSVGWYCGNCKNWHSPQVMTCPHPPRDDRSLAERIKVQNG